jgi:hypothetical protein
VGQNPSLSGVVTVPASSLLCRRVLLSRLVVEVSGGLWWWFQKVDLGFFFLSWVCLFFLYSVCSFALVVGEFALLLLLFFVCSLWSVCFFCGGSVCSVGGLEKQDVLWS